MKYKEFDAQKLVRQTLFRMSNSLISSFLFCKQNMVSQLVFILLNINIHFREIFLAENFVLSMIIRIFASSVLAKPLNNAQIVRGVFCLYSFEYGESYSLYKTV